MSRDTVEAAYREIGKQLRVPGLEDEKADVLGLVKQHISLESTGQWLFILDNADDVDLWFSPKSHSPAASRLAQYIPQSPRGRVLVTSRNRKTAVRMNVDHLPNLGELDADTAAELLRKWLPGRDPADESHNVQQLLEELAYLPIAIVQAAAYISENGISLAEYMALLNETEEARVELLSEDF
jgi:hypothetical protein